MMVNISISGVESVGIGLAKMRATVAMEVTTK